ncbi:MAG TPA: lyase family protein, partial [Anaerolineaceae bacterium]
MTLYSSRFSGSLDPRAAALNNSLPFDQRMAKVDVRGSLAWANAIGKAGVLNADELALISQGLSRILEEFEQGSFTFMETDEDIHTAVERRLIELVGPVGGKLHTGRSRNDQVATDLRLWLLDRIRFLQDELRGLQAALITRSEKDMGIILPGYTHFQQAQPVLLSHWWLSHFWALQRDQERLTHLR